jgi:hypothetical protein
MMSVGSQFGCFAIAAVLNACKGATGKFPNSPRDELETLVLPSAHRGAVVIGNSAS